MSQQFDICGYVFTDEKAAGVAIKENKAVQYLKPQIKGCEGKKLYAVYNQLLDKDMFHSSLGVDFLLEVRKKVLASKVVDSSKVRPIPKVIYVADKVNKDKPASKPMVKAVKSKSIGDDAVKNYKLACRALGVLCGILFVSVCAMFYITSTINSPNILNYEEVLVNKYASWDQELTEREAAVTIRENALK